MRLAANSLSHTGRTPGLQCTNASAGQDFFLRAHDSLMKATKNASPTRDQWLHTPNEIAFLSPLRRILAIHCFILLFFW